MDHREINHMWYEAFDEKAMTLEFENPNNGEMVEVPAEYVVCTVCSGKGKHVNPSVDSEGLTGEDFDQDPDLAENYFGGLYDVQCVGCRGKRVVPEIAEDAPPELKKLAEEVRDGYYEEQVNSWHERRMGY